MQWTRLARALFVMVLAAYVVAMSGCPSMRQNKDEVFLRESGGELHFWKRLPDASEVHWPYAWAAVSAYQDSDDPKRQPLVTTPTCPEPHTYLAARGWVQWLDIPSFRRREVEKYDALAEAMRDVHLRAEVWSNAETKQVVVAFGGTAASSWDDWRSNLRWIVYQPHDEYTVLTEQFVPVFVAAYLQRSREPGWEWLKGARVIAAGHSLGGGLAQRFAYSLQAKSDIPTVKEVFAFDPSPVSGKRSSPDFENQAKGLTIYWIYNRGEILASLRSLENAFNPGGARNQGQVWVDIRYRDDWTWRTLLPIGSVHAHGMYSLACFMTDSLPAAALPAAAASTSH